MNTLVKKYPIIVLMLVSLLMLFPNLGLIQTNIMEARNLITAREMVNDGHWIFTTLNGLPRYEKPPLPTWITAVCMMIFGMNNMFFLRLPAVLACLLLVYFFYKMMKMAELKNNQPLNASLILITSFYIFFAGRDNQWDIYTHAFMMGCIFYLYKFFKEGTASLKNIFIAGLFFGCSFLSKGPVSLYALFISFLLAYFFVYRNNLGRNLKWVLLALIIGLLIGLSWPLYVRFFDTADVHSALSQEADRWGTYDVKPFWHYWSFVTQSGLWTIPSLIALMFFYMKRRVENVKAYTFSFLWTVISVLLLSFIPEKKMRYLLPVLIPMAMNTSFYIEYLIANFKLIKNRFEKGLVYFNFDLVGTVALFAPVVLFFLFKEKLTGYILWYIIFAALSFLCGIILMTSLYKKQFSKTFYYTVFYMCCIVTAVIPLSKMFYSNKNYYSAANLHSFEKNLDIKTYETKDFIPEIIWDYGNSIPEIENGNSVITMPEDTVFGLLMFPKEITDITANFKNYSFTKLVSVDINAITKGEKGYSSRLQKDYYLVKKLD